MRTKAITFREAAAILKQQFPRMSKAIDGGEIFQGEKRGKKIIICKVSRVEFSQLVAVEKSGVTPDHLSAMGTDVLLTLNY